MKHAGLSIKSALTSGKVILRARSAIAVSQGHLEDQVDQLNAVLTEVKESLSHTPPNYIPQAWKFLRTGLSVLVAHCQCLSKAYAGNGDIATDQARLSVLLRELQGQLRFAGDILPDALETQRRNLCEMQECDAALLSRLLLAMPLPLIYWKIDKDEFFRVESEGTTAVSPSPLVRIIAFLDRVPVVTPQLVNAGVLYSVTFRVRGSGWPDQATSLQVALLTTCPREEYSVSTFVLARPSSMTGSEFEGEMTGQLRFSSPQSSFLDDLIFQLRGAFELPNSCFEDVPIIGQHEIRVRVVSPERHPLMGGNPRLDRHIEELVVKLLKECPSVREETGELLPILQALNLLLATYAQEAIFKGKSNVAEGDFHTVVLRDLRLQLGQEVQNHPHQGGGISDIRYRGVIVELKVEKDNGDRHYLCQKYTAQTVQYAGVEARQVAILLVLDLTEKSQPPGDIRNDVLLVDVPTHGGDDAGKTHPSKAFVFVVNGNMRSPSDYS